MKAICRYSGLDLLSSSGFARWQVVSEHPVFTVPLEELITLAASTWSPEMFVLDKKLLVLAIAKNCELITWENTRELMPAVPSIKTIESSIEQLLLVAGWIDFQRSVNKHSTYPQFRISEDTADMHTFPVMLKEIIDSRDYTEKQERREHRLICLENNARNLSARLRIGDNKEASLLRTTAEWAIMVTDEAIKAERVKVDISEYWKEILMTSASKLKAKKIPINDVEELREFMVDNLPHGSVIAHDVIAHLQRLISVNVFSDIDGGAIMSARMLTTGTLAPMVDEPKRSEFANLMEYARARSNWLLLQHQKEETAKALKVITSNLNARKEAAGDENDI